jgi:murein DD-endopeptidase MepM/ murein hydrolase activator NlpD
VTLVAPPVTHDTVVEAEDQTEGVLGILQDRLDESAVRTGIVEGANQQERIPIFYEYEVQEGDSLSSIAEHFGISAQYIAYNNVDTLTDQDTLLVGSRLQVPAEEGIIHAVRVGETVSQIASMYDASIADIVDFRANGFDGDPNNVREGSLILVPGGRIPPEPEPDPEPEPAAPSAEVAPAAPAAPAGPVEGSEVGPAEPPPPGGSGWVWPAGGMLSSAFGPAHPMGIDLAMSVGSPVAASEAGRVVFVGGNPCCSYGYHVIIDHGNGYETLYGHLSDFAVGMDQTVERGAIIGYSGNTGRSTGPHLHFEIKRNGAYQNPMLYLP